MRKIIMDSKIKILIGALVVGILVIGSWTIWKSQHIPTLGISVDGKLETITDIHLPIDEIEAEKIVKKFCEPKNPNYDYGYNAIKKVNDEWRIPIYNLNCPCYAVVNIESGETNCMKQIPIPFETQEVTITTDKTEYKQGEKIKVIIENNLNQSIWYYSADGYPSLYNCIDQPYALKIQHLKEKENTEIFSPSEVFKKSKVLEGKVIKVKGTVRGGVPMACTQRYCPPEDPCCNSCSWTLWLVNENVAGEGIQIVGEGAACSGTNCEATSCWPLQLGKKYIVKGKWKNHRLEIIEFEEITSEWGNIKVHHYCCFAKCLLKDPELRELKPGEKISGEWDQKVYDTGVGINGKLAEPGKYRFVFVYYLSNETKKPNYVYSNEFTIKSTSSGEIYIKGEPVIFSINARVKVLTNELPFKIVNEKGESIKLKHSCVGLVGCGVDQYCENGKIVRKEVYQLCDFSKKWCYGCSDAIGQREEYANETFVWDQKEYVEISEECEGKTIHREVKKQVPQGKYQIIVNGKVIKEFVIVPSECEGFLLEKDCLANDNCKAIYGLSYCSPKGICTQDWVFKSCVPSSFTSDEPENITKISCMPRVCYTY